MFYLLISIVLSILTLIHIFILNILIVLEFQYYMRNSGKSAKKAPIIKVQSIYSNKLLKLIMTHT